MGGVEDVLRRLELIVGVGHHFQGAFSFMGESMFLMSQRSVRTACVLGDSIFHRLLERFIQVLHKSILVLVIVEVKNTFKGGPPLSGRK